MYQSFFGLNEKPFAITPDPRYLFMSERHGEGLAHLLYGVTDSGGFIQLTGEVGTGKTTLVRTLLGQLPEQVDVALILNPQVTVLEFLRAICVELGVPLPSNPDSPMALVEALNQFLLDAHSRGRRIILLVDEAQNLSTEVLEQLRLLTNLETARQKLLQIILIGQPELRDVLAQNNLRQLAQRVTGRYHLEPLSAAEASQYISHRLRVAGAVAEVFDDKARREVHRLSGGIPRLINVLCDRALLGAYSRESRTVDRNLVRQAAREVEGAPDSRSQRWLKGIAAAAAIVLAVAMGYGVAALRNSEPSLERPAAASDSRANIVNEATVAANDAEPAEFSDELTTEASEPEASLALDAGLVDGSYAAPANSAIDGLLSLWGVDFDPNGDSGCRQAGQAGLACVAQDGSWGILKQLDRPAVLSLTDSQGNAHEVLLQSLDGDRVGLAFGDQARFFSVSEVSSLWYGRYLILWRPESGSVRAIVPGSRGADVAWLRQSLAELGALDSSLADGDSYDADLETAVRQFQRANRLKVDGLAGVQTQIVINSSLGRDAAPRLTGSS